MTNYLTKFNFFRFKDMEKGSYITMSVGEMSKKYENQQSFGNDTFAMLYYFISDTQISSCKLLRQIGSRFLYHSYDQSKSNIRIIPEVFRWHMLPWHVRKQSLIYEQLEKFILDCQQNGIIEHLVRNISPVFLQPDGIGPQVLTMFELSAGFIIWMGSVLVAICVFILEMIIHGLKQRTAKRAKNECE